MDAPVFGTGPASRRFLRVVGTAVCLIVLASCGGGSTHAEVRHSPASTAAQPQPAANACALLTPNDLAALLPGISPQATADETEDQSGTTCQIEDVDTQTGINITYANGSNPNVTPSVLLGTVSGQAAGLGTQSSVAVDPSGESGKVAVAASNGSAFYILLQSQTVQVTGGILVSLAKDALPRSALASTSTTTSTATSGAPGGVAALVRKSSPNGFVSVLVPANWEFRDETGQSNDLKWVWYDPADPSQSPRVISGACSTCVRGDPNNPGSPDTTPHPEDAPPLTDLSVGGPATISPISPDEIAFQRTTNGNPYPDNGIVIVAGSAGYVEADLWLPASEHATASAMLNGILESTNP